MADQLKYTEKDLLILVSEGDEQAFRQLFDQYKHKIFSLSMYLTRSEFLAEEITQEVFLKIWVNKINLREVECFIAYLRTIAHHVASNYLKRMAHEKLILQNLSLKSAESDRSTEQTIICNEYASILKKAIQKLPPQQKKVYILSREEGIKLEQIAINLNLSPYTVKEYMKKALASIHKYAGSRIELSLFLIHLLFFPM